MPCYQTSLQIIEETPELIVPDHELNMFKFLPKLLFKVITYSYYYSCSYYACILLVMQSLGLIKRTFTHSTKPQRNLSDLLQDLRSAKTIDKLERIQQRATKLVQGLYSTVTL